MKIEYLTQHPDFIPTVAGWLVSKWGPPLVPDSTVEKVIAKLVTRTNPDQIPITVIALENHTPLGTASLITKDMSTRPHLSPWLASVYVDPKFRNRGIGSQLVQWAMQKAKKLDIHTLYLFTPDKMSFYRRLNWSEIDQTVYRGENVTIMKYPV